MLKSSPVTIKPIQEENVSQLAQLANNKRIWDNLMDYIPHPYTIQDAYRFIATMSDENPQVTFGIYYKMELCGVIGLVLKTDVYRLTAELGYWVGEPYWGKGIATKAISLITSYGFNKLSLVRISANVFDHNQASMRVLEKNGFEKDAILKKRAIKNDQIIDLHVYSKTS